MGDEFYARENERRERAIELAKLEDRLTSKIERAGWGPMMLLCVVCYSVALSVLAIVAFEARSARACNHTLAAARTASDSLRVWRLLSDCR